MKSFRQFQEAKRSPERAEKLLDYMADRKRGDENEMPYHNYKGYGDVDVTDEEHFHYHGIQKVKVADLQAGQPWWSHAGVYHYLKAPEDHMKKPIMVAKDEDGLFVADGHHRWMTHRLLGKTHIDAHVYERKPPR